MSIINKKSGLLMYQKKSAEYMEKIKTTPYPDWKSLHQDLYGFILSKYILLGDVTDIYDLTELAELSVAKTIQMPKEGSKQSKADILENGNPPCRIPIFMVK